MLHLLMPLVFLGAAAGNIEYETLSITSTHDQTEQPVRYYAAPKEGPQPLLVLLHSWSTDINTYNPDTWVEAARSHGWHVVVPHFRGGNFNPEACASPAARQDILDAVTAMKARYAIDESRVYLAGSSGGGHMSMVMAGHSPETWTAVSAWVGISDLADWHAETKAAGIKYYKDIEACVGGAPISQSTINALAQEIVPPVAPVEDASYGRAIHLRESTGKTRVTIFEGGHEGIPVAGCAWLAQQQKK